jgi:hypothetical protein
MGKETRYTISIGGFINGSPEKVCSQIKGRNETRQKFDYFEYKNGSPFAINQQKNKSEHQTASSYHSHGNDVVITVTTPLLLLFVLTIIQRVP